MQQSVNKPVFIVGSPRSGTSILTWCLGQHPNMFAVPESNWMSHLALHLAVSHRIGSGQGPTSILSAMDIGRDEFFIRFGRSIDELIIPHRSDLEQKLKLRPSSEPKTRWVDGTPEYSMHIYALRKLFPEALFVHILRDVRDVVRSMLNFHRVAGTQLVANEEEAYKYWLRTVKACVQAEQAYGPKIVYRFPYSALNNNAEPAVRALLSFLGEAYDSRCLELLDQRINSSKVPEDFVADDPATDPAIVHEATKFSAEVFKTAQAIEPSAAAAEAMEEAFQQRVDYAAGLDKAYQECRLKLTQLEKGKA